MDRPLIFVVDDESKIRRLVAVNLESSGFDVMTADDGHRALEVFQHSNPKPDLIVLDVMMPGLDGMEVLKVIRQHSPVPVIIVSAKNDVRTKMEGFRLGTDDYLVKPFSIEELIMRIKAILRRSQQTEKTKTLSQEEIRNGFGQFIYGLPLCHGGYLGKRKPSRRKRRRRPATSLGWRRR